jgi:uncharacterized protein YfdQ (DUF2303 family)
VLPPEFTQEEITDPYGQKTRPPRYVGQTVTLQSKDSLVDYVNRFKLSSSILFADITNSSMKAAIDYHGASDGYGPGLTNYAAHFATMTLPFSEEWQTWTGISTKLMPQLEFARFIEENAADVAAPPGAELLDAVRDLQARRKVNFIKAVRTSSDNENFEYSDETEAKTKGGIEVPSRFLLKLPVYFGEPTTELFAFLRWRLDEGALALGVKLHRAEHVRQAVFKQIVIDIAERTGCPAVYGRL